MTAPRATADHLYGESDEPRGLLVERGQGEGKGDVVKRKIKKTVRLTLAVVGIRCHIGRLASSRCMEMRRVRRPKGFSEAVLAIRQRLSATAIRLP